MKIKDLITITIATAFLALCTIELINEITLARIGLTLVPLYIIIYVILAITHEKRLESELYKLHNKVSYTIDKLKLEELKCEELEFNFANQVKSTDLAEKERDNWRKKYENLNSKDISLKDLPFTDRTVDIEELHICESCDVEMYETKHYWICPTCKCRKKKLIK